jgi:hypothetical protein
MNHNIISGCLPEKIIIYLEAEDFTESVLS